jgi:hypothetical protein
MEAVKLYSGRGVDYKCNNLDDACAVAAHGFCVWARTLTGVSFDLNELVTMCSNGQGLIDNVLRLKAILELDA